MKFICEVGQDKFYIQKSVLGDRVTINVTDLKSLWQVSADEAEIVERFKSLNPLVQAKPEWIVTYVHSCLDPEKSTFGLKVEDSQKLTLNLHSSLDVKARMSFVLHRQDEQQFFRVVTNPMVAVITQLMEQRDKLLELVKSKDLELREYKLEGAEISRKNVETDEIIEKQFVTETTVEFTDRIRKEQRVPELKLTTDLNQVFSETMNLPPITVTKTEPEPADLPHSIARLLENGGTSKAVKADKRPLGNQTIIQAPRAKEKKKQLHL